MSACFSSFDPFHIDIEKLKKKNSSSLNSSFHDDGFLTCDDFINYCGDFYNLNETEMPPSNIEDDVTDKIILKSFVEFGEECRNTAEDVYERFREEHDIDLDLCGGDDSIASESITNYLFRVDSNGKYRRSSPIKRLEVNNKRPNKERTTLQNNNEEDEEIIGQLLGNETHLPTREDSTPIIITDDTLHNISTVFTKSMQNSFITRRENERQVTTTTTTEKVIPATDSNPKDNVECEKVVSLDVTDDTLHNISTVFTKSMQNSFITRRKNERQVTTTTTEKVIPATDSNPPDNVECEKVVSSDDSDKNTSFFAISKKNLQWLTKNKKSSITNHEEEENKKNLKPEDPQVSTDDNDDEERDVIESDIISDVIQEDENVLQSSNSSNEIIRDEKEDVVEDALEETHPSQLVESEASVEPSQTNETSEKPYDTCTVVDPTEDLESDVTEEEEQQPLPEHDTIEIGEEASIPEFDNMKSAADYINLQSSIASSGDILHPRDELVDSKSPVVIASGRENIMSSSNFYSESHIQTQLDEIRSILESTTFPRGSLSTQQVNHFDVATSPSTNTASVNNLTTERTEVPSVAKHGFKFKYHLNTLPQQQDDLRPLRSSDDILYNLNSLPQQDDLRPLRSSDDTLYNLNSLPQQDDLRQRSDHTLAAISAILKEDERAKETTSYLSWMNNPSSCSFYSPCTHNDISNCKSMENITTGKTADYSYSSYYDTINNNNQYNYPTQVQQEVSPMMTSFSTPTTVGENVYTSDTFVDESRYLNLEPAPAGLSSPVRRSRLQTRMRRLGT